MRPYAAINKSIGAYYAKTLQSHGPTPRGVDWNGEASQILRFKQLAKLLPAGRSFQVVDLGCGYGALYPYLRRHFPNLQRYTGYDLCQPMIRVSQRLHNQSAKAHFRWIRSLANIKPGEYCLASGILNVKMDFRIDFWRRYVLHVLSEMNRIGRKGVALNVLSRCSDPARRRKDLFYADPAWLLDQAARYSRHVALLQDYGLYEMTLLIRKDIP